MYFQKPTGTLLLAKLDGKPPLLAGGRRLLECAFNRLVLSARALHRLQKTARTIADLEGAQRVASERFAEAIQYRALDHLVADDAV